jgi:hypothetical protein
MKPNTAGWYEKNRARFASDAAFRQWHAARMARWRATHRRSYKAALRRNRVYLRESRARQQARIVLKIAARFRPGLRADMRRAFAVIRVAAAKLISKRRPTIVPCGKTGITGPI